MDWRTVRFDWNRARGFLVTAEEGSLTAAARALGMAQPTLGRQVSALEKELGVVLFERVGRGLSLTPSGRALLEHVRAMGEAAGRVSLAASGQSQSIDGTVCITASEVHCAYLLPPVVQRLRRDYPGIDLELVATNEARDLQRREADIAIRSFRPTEPELVARKLTDGLGHLYASPRYLARLGSPTSAEALSHAEFIGFDRTDALIGALASLGLHVTQGNFMVVSASHVTQWELVKQGIGLGVMQQEIGDAEPRVVRALPSLPPLRFPIWLTAHREVHTSRRIRLVFDLLAEMLGG